MECDKVTGSVCARHVKTELIVEFDQQLRAQAVAAAHEGKVLGVVMVNDNLAARPTREFWGSHMDDLKESVPGFTIPEPIVVRRAPGNGKWSEWDRAKREWVEKSADYVRGKLGALP